MTEPLLRLPYPTPLLPGTLIGRHNRFLADVRLDNGPRVTAHCVNTGRMEGLTLPGLRVWLSNDSSPTRKLQYTWQIAEVEGVRIGANTAIPNTLVGELLRQRRLHGFAWDELVGEKRYGANSRIDYWLRKGSREHFVEVKNCHLTYPDGRGYFPDSVSTRASKHLEELASEVRKGHRATVIFTAQRMDTKSVRPSDVHDPEFAKAARAAAENGVRFMALLVEPTPLELIVHRRIPVDLKPYPLEKPRTWMEANRERGPAWLTRAPE